MVSFFFGQNLKTSPLYAISKLTLHLNGKEISSSIEKKINLNAILESALLSISGLEDEKATLEQKIAELSGGREDIAASRNAISEEITDLKLKIIETQKDVENPLVL